MSDLTYLDVSLLILGYILGALPMGVWVSQFFELGDPRDHGSGNIGATNVLRSGNKKAAALTLFFDMFKGSAAVIFASVLSPSLAQYVGLMAVIGHVFPVFLIFKGGKGVATTLGIFLILSWPLALVCAVTWGVVALTSRYASLASIVAVGLSPFFTAALHGKGMIITCLLLGVLILWTHRANIGRLLTGRESEIGETSTEIIDED